METISLFTERAEEQTNYPTYSGLYKSFIQYIDINELISPSRQPLGKETLSRFAASLERDGFLRPVLVGKDGRIYDGAKRFAAARFLGYAHVPCAPYPTPLVFEDDVILNRLKIDPLDFFEYAETLKLLTGKHLYSQENIAAVLGRSQPFIANKLRLLKFTDKEKSIIRSSNMTERHCRTLLRIKDEKMRHEALARIASSGSNVSSAEEIVSSYLSSLPGKESFAAKLRSFLRANSTVGNIEFKEVMDRKGTVVFTISVPPECFT